MITLKNILVASDFGEASDAALAYGRLLARTFDATLHVLHVTEPVFLQAYGLDGFTPSMPDIQHEMENAAQKQLDELVRDGGGRGPAMRKVLRTASLPARAITDYAAEERVDLIVMGTHGRGGVARLLTGSVAERVVRTARCPVLTVRPPEHECLVADARGRERISQAARTIPQSNAPKLEHWPPMP